MIYYAIGDIHGMYEHLTKLYTKILDDIKVHQYQDYKIIFLGDYVDRGPDSFKVLEFVRDKVENDSQHHIAICGNHEELLFGGRVVQLGTSNHQTWMMNGGIATYQSFQKEADNLDTAVDILIKKWGEWCKTLPLFYSTPNYFFVHAGVRAGSSYDEQNQHDLVWIRWWEADYAWSIEHDEIPNWKHVVYGHTPERTPYKTKYSTGLDTGACFDGYGVLSCGVFHENDKFGPIYILQENNR